MFLVAFNSIDLCQSLCPSCMQILVLLNIGNIDGSLYLQEKQRTQGDGGKGRGGDINLADIY